MKVRVRFFSYFRDLAGCESFEHELAAGLRVSDLLELVGRKFPKFDRAKNCTLTAVGLDYVPRDYELKDGDELSLFPPVQGG